MEYILKYIDDNLSMRLSLRDVAAYAGYSTWHFCEKFKAFTGQTFTDYLRTRRMQYAVTALLRGRNIQEISAEAGYETVSGFERAFFKQYRCSPAEYKQRSVYYQERYEHERSKQLHISDRCQILREQIASPSKHWDFAAGLYSYYFWEGFFSLPGEQRSNYTTQAAVLSSIIENSITSIHANGDEILQSAPFQYRYLCFPATLIVYRVIKSSGWQICRIRSIGKQAVPFQTIFVGSGCPNSSALAFTRTGIYFVNRKTSFA